MLVSLVAYVTDAALATGYADPRGLAHGFLGGGGDVAANGYLFPAVYVVGGCGLSTTGGL